MERGVLGRADGLGDTFKELFGYWVLRVRWGGSVGQGEARLGTMAGSCS